MLTHNYLLYHILFTWACTFSICHITCSFLWLCSMLFVVELIEANRVELIEANHVSKSLEFPVSFQDAPFLQIALAVQRIKLEVKLLWFFY